MSCLILGRYRWPLSRRPLHSEAAGTTGGLRGNDRWGWGCRNVGRRRRPASFIWDRRVVTSPRPFDCQPPDRTSTPTTPPPPDPPSDTRTPVCPTPQTAETPWQLGADDTCQRRDSVSTVSESGSATDTPHLYPPLLPCDSCHHIKRTLCLLLVMTLLCCIAGCTREQQWEKH